MTAEATEYIAEHASLIMWKLLEDDRFARWYNADRWHGRIGLANHVATAAVALEEQLAPRDWSEVDRYLTASSVANAILRDELDTRDMSRYYEEIGSVEALPVEPSFDDPTGDTESSDFDWSDFVEEG